MAIALDTTTGGVATATTPLAWNHTCTGNNLILIVSIVINSSGSSSCSGVTYNGVAMTKIDSQQYNGTVNEISLWYLINPATGSHSISASFSGTTPTCDGGAASYTGAKQSGQPDASGKGTGNSATASKAVVSIADNCWHVGVGGSEASKTITASNTSRNAQTASTANANLEDSNSAKTPAGSVTLSWAVGGGGGLWAAIVASIAPSLPAQGGGFFRIFGAR